jgi:hypothetical protein
MSNAIIYLAETLADAMSGSHTVHYAHKAIEILTEMSQKSLLDKKYIADAMRLFTDEKKAEMFYLMKDTEIRMLYLRMELKIEEFDEKF